MNEHDSERIASVLAADGMTRTDDLEQADVVVLNTCCIRQNADDRLYGHLGQLKSVQERRPGLQIAVGGCLAQKDRELLLERAPHVDAVFGTHNLGRVAALLGLARSSGESVLEVPEAPGRDEEADFPTAMAVRHDQPHAAWVTIQVGCNNSCAFCIVPAVRGPEVSRPFGELVEELEGLAARGTVEITLLGQNVNSYGRDLTTKWRGAAAKDADLAWIAGERWVRDGARKARPLFADLLRDLGAVPGIDRVRFTSPHPKDLRPETIAAMAETPAVCEQLHLPLQSGSNRVLRAMRRGYTAERYLALLADARAAIKDLAVTTDIIVGFPGETAQDFERTLEVASQAAYDSAYTFIFSPRPGTRAAQMTEMYVDPGEVARSDGVAYLGSRRADGISPRTLARETSALRGLYGFLAAEKVVEGPSRKDPEVLSGRTRQGKLVHFSPPEGGNLAPGTFVNVRIDRAAPHYLAGALVSSGQGTGRRVGAPIPVVAG